MRKISRLHAEVQRKQNKFIKNKKQHQWTGTDIATFYGVGLTTARRWKRDLGWDHRSEMRAKRDTLKSRFLIDWDENVKDGQSTMAIAAFQRKYKCTNNEIRWVLNVLNVDWETRAAKHRASEWKEYQPALSKEATEVCQQMNGWGR